MKIHINPFVHPKKPKQPDNGDFLMQGFTRHPFGPQEPLEYPSEHEDHVHDTDMGFCERNNYGDRY